MPRCLHYLLQDADGKDIGASLIMHAQHHAHLQSMLGFLDAFLDMWFLNIVQHTSYLTHKCLHAGTEDVLRKYAMLPSNGQDLQPGRH